MRVNRTGTGDDDPTRTHQQGCRVAPDEQISGTETTLESCRFLSLCVWPLAPPGAGGGGRTERLPVCH